MEIHKNLGYYAKIKSCAPLLGQHTEEIYKKILNLSEKKIKEYKSKGVM